MDRPWEANPTSAADERDVVHRSDSGSRDFRGGLTGSPPTTNTIGMTFVVALAVMTAGVVPIPTMTATGSMRRATTSLMGRT